MSYLDEVKTTVSSAKEVKKELYKQFVEDFLIEDFIKSTNQTASVTRKELINNDLHVEHFIVWLKEEGFQVEETSDNNEMYIIISYT